MSSNLRFKRKSKGQRQDSKQQVPYQPLRFRDSPFLQNLNPNAYSRTSSQLFSDMALKSERQQKFNYDSYDLKSIQKLSQSLGPKQNGARNWQDLVMKGQRDSILYQRLSLNDEPYYLNKFSTANRQLGTRFTTGR